MYSFFVRALLIVFALWVLRRVLGMLFGEPQKQDQTRREDKRISSNKTVRDPVCGMYMDPRLAVRLEGKNETFYFCSDECRKKYLA